MHSPRSHAFVSSRSEIVAPARSLHASSRRSDEGPSRRRNNEIELDSDLDRSTAFDEATEAQEDPPRPSSSKSTSAYDDLFSGSDPFPTVFGQPSSGRGFGLSRGAKSNRSADASGSGGGQRHPPREDVRRQGRDDSKDSRMSKQETQTWAKLLDEMAGVWNDPSSSNSAKAGGSKSALGLFADRNQLLSKDKRGDVQRKKRNLLGMGEGPAADLSAEEMDAGVDRAEERMNMCSTEVELWQWASREIWGYDEPKHRRELQERKRQEELALKRRPQETASEGTPESQPAQLSDEESATEDPTTTAPYGPSTPFYAPVLHRLFRQLRDRFKSPQTALCILPIVRGLGPQSLVLGCSSELYSEALQTRWFWLKDVRGTLDTIKEAKSIGLLSRAPTDVVGGGPSRGSATRASGRNKDPVKDQLVKTIQKIQSDVRRSVLSRRANRSEAVPGSLGSRDDEQSGGARSNNTNTDSSEDIFSTDWFNESKDAQQDSSNGSDGSFDLGAMDASPQAASRIDLSSLSMASLEALQMADEMNEIVYGPQRQKASQSGGGGDGKGSGSGSDVTARRGSEGRRSQEGTGWFSDRMDARHETGLRPKAASDRRSNRSAYNDGGRGGRERSGNRSGRPRRQQRGERGLFDDDGGGGGGRGPSFSFLDRLD